MPPPHLDRACDVLTLDADALSGRELELLIVVEQPAVSSRKSMGFLEAAVP